MDGHGIGTFFTVLVSSAFGLAILSVVLSNKSQTTGVIQAGASGLGSIISAAEGPVTGQTAGTNNFSSLGTASGNLLGNSAGSQIY